MTEPPRNPEQTGTAAQPADERDLTIARLEQALAEARARGEAAESLVADQKERLKTLGSGREESLLALAAARDELRRMSIERDELRRQLKRIDSVQSATIALPEDDSSPSAIVPELPSIEDLMLAMGSVQEKDVGTARAGHLHQLVQSEQDGAESNEMLSPEVVFPEEYAASGNAGESSSGHGSRLLVLLDLEKPVKYPLDKEVMTIGRADIADIKINNGFLSRLHARVVATRDGIVIEDVESKNGIKVNSKITPRQALRHGDIVELGRVRFRFLDTASDERD